MVELSSEEKAKYVKIRDDYKKIKEHVLQTVNNHSGTGPTKYQSLNTKGYETMLTDLSNTLNLQNASENIKKNYAQITGLVQAITVLDTEIRTNIASILEKSRPSIPGAEQECLSCDMKSVFFIGRLPQGGSGPDSHNECVLCGRNNLSDGFRYDKKNW